MEKEETIQRLTRKEWLKERWFVILLYLVVTMALIIPYVVGLSDPTMTLGKLLGCLILGCVGVGIGVLLITSDSRCVGKCLKCGKILLVVEDTCPCCGTKTEI